MAEWGIRLMISIIDKYQQYGNNIKAFTNGAKT